MKNESYDITYNYLENYISIETFVFIIHTSIEFTMTYDNSCFENC